MSFILDALKKAECERDVTQFVEYSDNLKKKSWVMKIFWVWGILVFALLVFTILLWPIKMVASQQVLSIVPPAQSVLFSE